MKINEFACYRQFEYRSCHKDRAAAKSGETIRGTDFVTVCGGKGGNQAIAAAKLGADVSMIGNVGDDDFGNMLVGNLKR